MLNLRTRSGVPESIGDPSGRPLQCGLNLDAAVPEAVKSVTDSSVSSAIDLDSAPPPNPNSEPEVPGSLSSP